MRYLMIACLLSMVQYARAADQDMHACVSIQDATQRLDCYDRIAHRASSGPPAQGTAPPHANTAPATAPQPTETSIAIPDKPVETAADRTLSRTFGERRSDADEGDRISATLVKARRNKVRLYVFTLDNGQVWMQREPGDRPIKADQGVTITRRRWSYQMFLEGQDFNVTVQRVR